MAWFFELVNPRASYPRIQLLNTITLACVKGKAFRNQTAVVPAACL
jgi:hypothetical protein